ALRLGERELRRADQAAQHTGELQVDDRGSQQSPALDPCGDSRAPIARKKPADQGRGVDDDHSGRPSWRAARMSSVLTLPLTLLRNSATSATTPSSTGAGSSPSANRSWR